MHSNLLIFKINQKLIKKINQKKLIKKKIIKDWFLDLPWDLDGPDKSN